MADKERIQYLIKKLQQEGLSDSELSEIDAWKEELGLGEGDILEGLAIMNEASAFQASEKSRIEYPKADAQTQKADVKKWLGINRGYLSAMAAAFVLLIVSWSLWMKGASKPDLPEPVPSSRNDVLPGGAHATLKLADGSTISLDSAQNGLLSNQGSSRVVKLANGKLAYKIASISPVVLYNTIFVPAGGEYELTLPDNSKIWMNSKSSLRFPTSFEGNDRVVELTGEAYLEVARNVDKPFSVKVNGVTVKVLGTRFNIMAYSNEKTIRTTLLEGSIEVNHESETVILHPSQEANISDKIIVQKRADTAAAIAWKNGLFRFDNADIETIMRTLARWYDVDVKFEGPINHYILAGSVRRDNNLSGVLAMLELSGFKFKLNGKTITVLPLSK